MGRLSFEQYRRRLDCWEYRAKRRDVPQDLALLLELNREIEFSDRLTIDTSDSAK